MAGASARQIAVELGVSTQRVRKIVAARGVKRSRGEEAARKRAEAGPAGRERKVEWPAELVAEILTRYAAGEPGPAIAETLGLTRWRVYALLRERGMVRTKSEARVLREARRRPARTEE